MSGVSLPMYVLPQLDNVNHVWQQAIVGHAQALGLETFDLKQICGWPLVAGDRGTYQVVASPHYKAEGCEDYFYSSLMVVRADRHRSCLEDLEGSTAAINSFGSCSGYLLLTAALGRDLAKSIQEMTTGAHIKSIQAVVEGRADFACIDAVTFAHYKRYNKDVTDQLKVLGGTPKFPALPYVTPSHVGSHEVGLLQKALQRALEDPTPEVVKARETLLIHGFSPIDFDAYDRRALEILGEITSETIEKPLNQSEDEVRIDLLQLQPLDIQRIQKAINVARQNRRPVVDFTLDDSRVGQLCFPGDLDDPFESDPNLLRDCTVFLGERPRLVDRCLNDNEISSACWKVDAEMSANFDPLVIWVYLSMELAPGGNYYNIVIYRPGKNAEDIRKDNNSTHRTGITQVAPFYYNNVRIHRCLVSLNEIQLKQTLAVKYHKGRTLFRKSFMWEHNT